MKVLYPSPGYPIYESMIRFLGGVPVPYSFDDIDDVDDATDVNGDEEDRARAATVTTEAAVDGVDDTTDAHAAAAAAAATAAAAAAASSSKASRGGSGAGRFAIDLQGVRASVTSRTVALIFNNNHNPTGHCASADELAQLADVCVANVRTQHEICSLHFCLFLLFARVFMCVTPLCVC
jgi:aspartate/methionine/tyrosine aminotransferase